MKDFTHAFAAPGQDSIVDVINPVTGLSAINGETLDEVRLRYPGAQHILISEWLAERAAAQDTPIGWDETTEEEYEEMLGVLPPAFWRGGLFLVGEPMDHHAGTGRPRYSAFRRIGARYFRASRPITRSEAMVEMEKGATA